MTNLPITQHSMQLRILKPGIQSTVQDIGRWEYLAQGVPISGSMDTVSARLANLAVGNTGDAAVIEFTYGDTELLVEAAALFAYSGDGATLHTDATALPCDRPLWLPAGTRIRLVTQPSGSRTYLAVAGGWQVAKVLGSRSTYLPASFGGFLGRTLRAGDTLQAGTVQTPITAALLDRLGGATPAFPDWSLARPLFFPGERQTVRVVPAHEFTWFNGKSVVDFLTSPYTVSRQSDRMGYRLEGPRIRRIKPRELLSTAVVPGTIQVTGDGGLVLLMADCQTTGGYPRIAQVAAVDMPVCAQWKPGDRIRFQEISRSEAEKLYRSRERQWNRLTASLALRILCTER